MQVLFKDEERFEIAEVLGMPNDYYDIDIKKGIVVFQT